MFDGAEFPRQPPGRRPVNETAVTIVIVALALGLLFMPISLDAIVDIIRYLHGH